MRTEMGEVLMGTRVECGVACVARVPAAWSNQEVMARTFVFFAILVATTVRAQPADAERDVHAAIARFFGALARADLAAARAAAVVRPEDAALLEAMAAWYAAQSDFHDAFKKLTGFDPGPDLSMRTGITKFMPDGEVLVSADGTAAHCFWGDISLRKVDGQWRFDLAEYDRTRALTEQLGVLRDEPAFWREAVARLRADKPKWWGAAEELVRDVRGPLVRRHKEVIAAADRLRAERCFADLQGRWRVTISAAPDKADPKFDKGTATLTINEKMLTVDASERSLNGSMPLQFWSFCVRGGARDDDPIGAEWSAVFRRSLGELRGTLLVPGRGRSSVYTVVGTRAP
jgi:hypothetical protein